MKKVLLCAALLGLWPALGFAQSNDELVNDGKNTDNVTTESMGYRPQELQPAEANQ